MTEQFELGLTKVAFSWSADKAIINRLIQLEVAWLKAWEMKSTYGEHVSEHKMDFVEEYQNFIEKELDRLTEIMKARVK